MNRFFHLLVICLMVCTFTACNRYTQIQLKNHTVHTGFAEHSQAFSRTYAGNGAALSPREVRNQVICLWKGQYR